MTDQSIFGNQSNQAVDPATQQQQTQNANPLATLLADIKNENGQQKYQSAEEALRGAAHAQEYIRTLQREKAEAEARLTALAGKEDKTAELERTLAELMQKVNKPAEPASNVPTGDDIAAIVANTLDQRDSAKVAKSNKDAVATALLKAFGAEAETKYNAAAQELGLTPSEMNDLAAKSPKAVLKALGVSEQVAKPQSFAPANSTFNTAALQPHQDSFVGRNKETVAVGATTGDMMAENARAKKMAEELHANGLTAADLSDPKVYFRYFSK